MLLEVRDLSKRFGQTEVVRSLSFSVSRGEVFGLLGPNGAGKTTTISMISGVTSVGAGSVILDGVSLSADPLGVRRALGLVPQELALYDELSALENLRFFAGLHGMRGDELRAGLEWTLALADLESRADDKVATFSGGMKRRLNLAAGLIHKPKLLVLDEPAVGVDPQSRVHLFEVIRRLADEGMGVIYTSHYLEEVEALCDRVTIIDHGEVLVAGRVHELMDKYHREGVRITFQGDEGAVRAAIESVDGASMVEGDVVATHPTLAPVIGAIESTGATIDEVARDRVTLESVFLDLTGRKLRDE